MSTERHMTQEDTVPNEVSTYTWNWIDDWDNYSVWYNKEEDCICDTMTSSSRFGGGCKVEGITKEMQPKAYNAWKRQAVAKIIKERTITSTIPTSIKEVKIVNVSRGKMIPVKGKTGTVVWTGKRRKFQFRDTPYHRDYMDEEVAKVEIDGIIWWVPFTKCEVVNAEQYIPSEERAYRMVEEYVINNGVPWVYVCDNCKWKW